MTAAVQDTLDLIAAPEPPCNHGAHYTQADGARRCLLCPSTSDDVLPLTVHDTPAILHAVLTDPLPARQTDREHIEAAIRAAAAEHGGYVTAAWVRPHITRDVLPQMVGAVMGNGGLLEPTGRIERNEGGNGNALKWSPVWRLIDTRKH